MKLSVTFINDTANVQTALEKLLIARAELLPELLQAHQRRLTSELGDDVFLRLRDDHVLPDWPATLRDNAPDGHRPLHNHSHGSPRQCSVALEQLRLATPAAPAPP